MKRISAIIIFAAVVLTLTACGGEQQPTQTTTTEASASSIGSALELLTTVWSSYGEEEKFAASGGDASEENMSMDGPGKYGIEDAGALDSTLGFPAASADKIDDAASLMHMMNANTFTCGAFHLKNPADSASLAQEIKTNIMQRQWLCGFPDKVVIVAVDDYLVSFFGNNEIIDTFKAKLISAYPSAEVLSEDAIL